jgi:hypothetical protein
LREFEKENPSRRISEGLEATRSEQQQGTLARKTINDSAADREQWEIIKREFEEIQNLTQFKTFSNQITQEDAIVIDSKYDCHYVQNNDKIQIHRGINKIMKSQLKSFSKYCRLKGGQNFRIIIEEQYNLIIFTVFKMIDWWEVLQEPIINN